MEKKKREGKNNLKNTCKDLDHLTEEMRPPAARNFSRCESSEGLLGL